MTFPVIIPHNMPQISVAEKVGNAFQFKTVYDSLQSAYQNLYYTFCGLLLFGRLKRSAQLQ